MSFDLAAFLHTQLVQYIRDITVVVTALVTAYQVIADAIRKAK